MTPAIENDAQLVTELVVPNLSETVAFLVALGFRVDRTDGGFAVLRWNDAFLFVAEDPGALVEHRWANVRVIVPDAAVMRTRAVQLDGMIVSEIGDRSYGLRDFIVQGPGGIEIRFAEILPSR
jgi:catechol 2,3-dioxygenase-like lactoylglutathione lyase family enzyme